MKRHLLLLFTLTSVLFASAGGAFALTVLESAEWPTPFIVVCWENGNGKSAPEQWVREAAERTWMRELRIVFAGWGACQPNTKGIRITIENGVTPPDGYKNPKKYGWPHAHGPQGDMVGQMWLTFDFAYQASVFPDCTGVGPANRYCIEWTAVHEFGHALGFEHEQRRKDVPVSCVSQLGPDYPEDGNSAISGDVKPLGPFDQYSVMAYCNAAWNNRGRLSPNDIFYLQSIYGRKAAGSVVGFDGRCMESAGGNANSSRIQTRDCLGGTQFAPGDIAPPNQRWFYAPGNSFILANTQRVLDVPQNDSANGKQLQLFDSLAGAPGQHWAMPRARIRSLGGMCLRPVTLPAAEGTELGLYPCGPPWAGLRAVFSYDFTSIENIRVKQDSGRPITVSQIAERVDPNARMNNPAYVFEFGADGTIRHIATGLCAQPLDANSPGSRYVLRNCSGATEQKHRLTAGGSITGSGGQCLDVGVVSGTRPDQFFEVGGINRLQTWTCNGWENQKFSLYGNIVGLANKCVDVANLSHENGTPWQLWDCNGNENQYFEVYW